VHLGRIRPLFSLVVLCLAVGGPAVASGQTQSTDPATVMETYERARAAGDVDAALAQFADDAVVTVQGRAAKSYSGKDQVRAYLETVGVRFKLIMRSSPLVQGVTVSWIERDEFPTMSIDATVLAIIRSGSISSLIYRNGDPFGFQPGGASAAAATAPPRARELPSYAWPAALALLGMALISVIFGRPRRRTPSRLDGRLLVALQDHREHKAA
jgi:hypothetical protein